MAPVGTALRPVAASLSSAAAARWVPAVVMVLALTVLLSGVGAAALLQGERRLTALGARTGFSPGSGIIFSDPDDMERELDAVVESGAAWVRLDVDWSHVERTRGHYDWSRVDRVVGAARDRELEVLALLAYTPKWARPTGTSSHAPPEDPTAFAAFASAAAERYRPRGVRTYEIWNEPNLPRFWEPRPDVPAYVVLFTAAAAAVKRSAPDATVLSGGLAPASDDEESGAVDPRTFLQQVYELGAAPLTDGVALHPYSYPATPLQDGTSEWNTFQKMPAMRATMEEYGDADAELWLTEVGAPTGSARSAVDEELQAEIVVEAVTRAAELAWTGPVFVYAIRDAGDDREDREDNFGLLSRDFATKAGFDRLRELLT